MDLSLENVTKSFGGLRAVGGVSFSVRGNVIFGLIGPNGAGKTTVFNLITGVYKHDGGSIRWGAKDLGPLKPAQIAANGIGRTFQNIRLFGQLTVIENLLVACELQKKAHLASAILRLPSHFEDEATMHARALELLRVFELHEMADDAPTSLSYGNQRRLEIARAMMLRPKLLLLDEPAAGMNYGEAEGLQTQIRWLRDTFELAIVLVEHNMQVVMGVCEEIHVLDHGETIAHGAPAEIMKHPKVLAAYLGEEEESAASVQAVVAGRDRSAPPPRVSSRRELAVAPAPALVPQPSPLPLPAPSRQPRGPRLEPLPLIGGDAPGRMTETGVVKLSEELLAKLEEGLSSADLGASLGQPWAKPEPTAPSSTPPPGPPLASFPDLSEPESVRGGTIRLQVPVPIGGTGLPVLGSPDPDDETALRFSEETQVAPASEPSTPDLDDVEPETQLNTSIVPDDTPSETHSFGPESPRAPVTEPFGGKPPPQPSVPKIEPPNPRPLIRRKSGPLSVSPRPSSPSVSPKPPFVTPPRPTGSPDVPTRPAFNPVPLSSIDKGWSSTRQPVAEEHLAATTRVSPFVDPEKDGD